MTSPNTPTAALEELKPCPFCGSRDIDPEFWASVDRSGPACSNCGASADTVVLWNTRSPEALSAQPTLSDMAALSASDAACYAYPGEDDGPLREAFVEGARHVTQPQQAVAWRPIESAPRDGTLVLLSKADDADWPLRCRRWENGHWRGHDAADATHWMPLPAPPLAAALAAPEGDALKGSIQTGAAGGLKSP